MTSSLCTRVEERLEDLADPVVAEHHRGTSSSRNGPSRNGPSRTGSGDSGGAREVASDLVELAAHVRSCPRCGASVESYRQTIDRLRELPDVPVPGDFLKWVGQRLDRADAASKRARAIAQFGFAVAVVSLAVGVGLAVWLLDRGEGPPGTPLGTHGDPPADQRPAAVDDSTEERRVAVGVSRERPKARARVAWEHEFSVPPGDTSVASFERRLEAWNVTREKRSDGATSFVVELPRDDLSRMTALLAEWSRDAAPRSLPGVTESGVGPGVESGVESGVDPEAEDGSRAAGTDDGAAAGTDDGAEGKSREGGRRRCGTSSARVARRWFAVSSAAAHHRLRGHGHHGDPRRDDSLTAW